MMNNNNNKHQETISRIALVGLLNRLKETAEGRVKNVGSPKALEKICAAIERMIRRDISTEITLLKDPEAPPNKHLPTDLYFKVRYVFGDLYALSQYVDREEAELIKYVNFRRKAEGSLCGPNIIEWHIDDSFDPETCSMLHHPLNEKRKGDTVYDCLSDEDVEVIMVVGSNLVLKTSTPPNVADLNGCVKRSSCIYDVLPTKFVDKKAYHSYLKAAVKRSGL